MDIWNMKNYPGEAGDRKYKLAEIANIENKNTNSNKYLDYFFNLKVRLFRFNRW